MRTIDADLTTEQQQPSRAPYVSALIKNQVDNVRRLDFTLLNDTVNAQTKHDVACDANGNVHRVRMAAGAVKYNRVLAADTATAAAYDSYVDLATGRGTNVASAAFGARVVVVYTNTAGTTVFMRESTDNGANFAAEATVTAAPGGTVLDLAVAYKNSTGDLLIAWCLAASMRAIRRTAGAFGSVLNPGDTYGSLNAVALTHAFDYEILFTGQELTSVKPTVWTRVLGDGVAAAVGVWSTPKIIIQSATGLVVFQAPSLDYLDTWRACFSELPTWSGADTRHYRTSLHSSLLFTAGPYSWHTPLPSDDTFVQGMAIAHTTTHFYESACHLVRRAKTALETRDATGDLLALEVHEDPLDAHGWIDIDNSAKTYRPLAEGGDNPEDPLKVGNLVELAFGYYVSADGANRTSQIQDLWITAVEFRRHTGAARDPRRRPTRPGAAIMRLHVEGGLRRLRRNFQRYHVSHPGADDARTIIAAILLRTGISTSVTLASARSDTFLPNFHIAPDHSGHTALRAILDLLADRVRMRAGCSAHLDEPLAADTTDYSVTLVDDQQGAIFYGTGTAAGPHRVYSQALRDEAPPAGELLVHSLDGSNNYLTGQAFDHPSNEHGLAPLARLRSLTDDVGSEADATATAHLRQRTLDQDLGRVTCPPVCGLELLDCLTVTDVYSRASALLRRVRGITWRLDRPAGRYEQEIALGPV